MLCNLCFIYVFFNFDGKIPIPSEDIAISTSLWHGKFLVKTPQLIQCILHPLMTFIWNQGESFWSICYPFMRWYVVSDFAFVRYFCWWTCGCSVLRQYNTFFYPASYRYCCICLSPISIGCSVRRRLDMLRASGDACQIIFIAESRWCHIKHAIDTKVLSDQGYPA